LLFILAQTGRERFVTRPIVLSLLVVPVLYWVVVWTNEAHHLHWQAVETVSVEGLVFLTQTYSNHPIFWLQILYLYLVLLVSFYLIVSKLITASGPFRNQYLLLLLALLFPWVMNVVEVMDINPVKHLALVLYGIMLACLPIAWALFRHRLLDLTPAAHEMVIRSIGDAVFVLDRENRVVDANPAGARFLEVELAQLIGQPAGQFFADSLGKLDRFAQQVDLQEQITRGHGADERYYDVRISPLYTHWGQVNGRVIALRDLTHQKQAERQAAAPVLE
jgi:PAS domain S-box-containing protein